MKNIVEVIRQKEAEVERIQSEIQALRVAQRLLADEGDAEPTIAHPLTSTGTTPKTATLRQFP